MDYFQTITYLRNQNISFSRNYDFRGNVYSWCFFSGERLENCNFSKFNFNNIDMDVGFVEGCDFTKAILDEGRFKEAAFIDTKFTEASLQNATFTGSHFNRVSFEGADLRGCLFKDCNLMGANFRHADLRGAVFCGITDISRAVFAEADLRYATFMVNKSKFVNFEKAKTELARLEGEKWACANYFGTEKYADKTKEECLQRAVRKWFFPPELHDGVVVDASEDCIDDTVLLEVVTPEWDLPMPESVKGPIADAFELFYGAKPSVMVDENLLRFKL